MEIQSESWKLEVMIIPSTSPLIDAILHFKSPTSHPRSNENQNWITDNDKPIRNAPTELVIQPHRIHSNANSTQVYPSARQLNPSSYCIVLIQNITIQQWISPFSTPFPIDSLPPMKSTPHNSTPLIQSFNLSIALILAIQQRTTSQHILFRPLIFSICPQHLPHSNPFISLRFLTTKESSTRE